MYGSIDRFSAKERLYPRYIHGNLIDNSVSQPEQNHSFSGQGENIAYVVAKVLKKCSTNERINHFYDQSPIEENIVFSPSGLLPYLVAFANDFSKSRIGTDVIDAHFSYDENAIGGIKVEIKNRNDNKMSFPVSISIMFLLDAMLSSARNNHLEWRNIVLNAISILSSERGMKMIERIDDKFKHLIAFTHRDVSKFIV